MNLQVTFFLSAAEVAANDAVEWNQAREALLALKRRRSQHKTASLSGLASETNYEVLRELAQSKRRPS